MKMYTLKSIKPLGWILVLLMSCNLFISGPIGVSAAIPRQYEQADPVDDIVFNYYNNSTEEFEVINGSTEKEIDILSLAYSYDETTDNISISLELNGPPVVNGSYYYRIQHVTENSTSRFSIDIQLGVPGLNYSTSVYTIGVQGNVYELEVYVIVPTVDGNVITWEVQTKPIFSPSTLFDDPSLVLTLFSGVVESYENRSYYRDSIEIEDIQVGSINSTDTPTEELFDIIDPVALVVFLVVPLVVIVYLIIRRRSVY